MFCLYLLLKASRKNKYNVTFNSKLSVKVRVVSDCGSLTRVVGFLQDTIINVPLVGGCYRGTQNAWTPQKFPVVARRQ